MKGYLLFVFSEFYPEGGWDDFVGSYDTIEEARNHLGESGFNFDFDSKYQYQIYQIVDIFDGKIVDTQDCRNK